MFVAKTEHEMCKIETSINSVRISIKIRKPQEIEVLIVAMLERFMALRADKFEILRKKPASPDFDFSFLVSADHLQRYRKEEIINFILEFIQGIDKEINEMKLEVVNHARVAVNFFVNACSNNKIDWIINNANPSQ